MFGLTKVVATLVAVAALAVPSLALADNHGPNVRRAGDHASIQHRDSRDSRVARDHRGEWERDGRGRHDRHERGWRDCRDHGRRR